jgi:NADP-dependent 3-hydroxy acid dehydrogenase YdfG
MSTDLKNTVAIITGASSGIGAATARSLASMGASVALVARRGDRLSALAAEITGLGGRALAIPADITDHTQAEGAIARTIEHFGQLDILVNNAGIMVVETVADADLSSLDRMIDINNKALLYMTKASIPHLQSAAAHGDRRVADIVNVSSLLGRISWGNYASYSLTKYGVNGFSEGLRQELAPKHVRVTVVEPGGTRTELNDYHTNASIEAGIKDFYGSIEALEAEDIADGITYAVTRQRRMAIRELFIMPTNQI